MYRKKEILPKISAKKHQIIATKYVVRKEKN